MVREFYVESDNGVSIIKACDNCSRDYYRDGHFIQLVDGSKPINGKCGINHSTCTCKN